MKKVVRIYSAKDWPTVIRDDVNKKTRLLDEELKSNYPKEREEVLKLLHEERGGAYDSDAITSAALKTLLTVLQKHYPPLLKIYSDMPYMPTKVMQIDPNTPYEIQGD